MLDITRLCVLLLCLQVDTARDVGVVKGQNPLGLHVASPQQVGNYGETFKRV